tara:strand:+ start:38 stop:298 length:261 start_codon:yes stop_codon:yes gene_type:complete
MTKFSLVTFKITNGSCEHYEYSYYESKNISGLSHKEIVQDFIGSEVEVDKNDMHKFWFNDFRTIEVYGIEPMTDVELGVFKKFGVL